MGVINHTHIESTIIYIIKPSIKFVNLSKHKSFLKSNKKIKLFYAK